jgi:hypothetical protein
VAGPGMGHEPGVRQQVREAAGRMSGQVPQHILEISERVDLVPLAAGHDAVQDRRRPTAPVAPNEQVVLPLMRISA